MIKRDLLLDKGAEQRQMHLWQKLKVIVSLDAPRLCLQMTPEHIPGVAKGHEVQFGSLHRH